MVKVKTKSGKVVNVENYETLQNFKIVLNEKFLQETKSDGEIKVVNFNLNSCIREIYNYRSYKKEESYKIPENIVVFNEKYSDTIKDFFNKSEQELWKQYYFTSHDIDRLLKGYSYQKTSSNNFKYIDVQSRIKYAEELFTEIDIALNFCKTSPFEDKSLDRGFCTKFWSDDFVQLCVFGEWLDTLENESTIFTCNDHCTVSVYQPNVSKKDFSRTIKNCIEKFNARFGTIVDFKLSVKRIKYLDLSLNTSATDRYGNIINIGDLVISPQCNRDSGSWVDPFIVARIENDRLYIKQVEKFFSRSYYIANRCIVLRSKNNNKLSYGELDWIK